MTPAAHRLIDAATTPPLADNAELQAAARSMIGREIDSSADDAEIERLAARLETRGSRRWRWLLAVLMLAVFLPIGIPAVKRTVEEVQWIFFNPSNGDLLASAAPGWWEALDPTARLLFASGERWSESQAASDALWKLHPDHPPFHQIYAYNWLREHDELPPDYLATGSRIDSGNGWYPLYAAAAETRHAVLREALPADDRAKAVSFSWTIVAPAKLDRALRWFRDAAEAPRIEHYEHSVDALRMAHLSTGDDFLAKVRADAVKEATDSSYVIPVNLVGDLVGAAAQRVREQGDADGFRRLAADWERITARLLDLPPRNVDGLSLEAAHAVALPALRDAAVVLGVDSEEWVARDFRLRERQRAIQIRNDAERGTEFARRRGAVVSWTAGAAGRLASHLAGKAPVSAADFLPGSRIEHAVLARMLAGGVWLIIGLVLVLIVAGRWADRPLVRLLSQRLGRMLRLRDWYWIVGTGVLAPTVVFLVIRYASPLGRLDWKVLLPIEDLQLGQWDLSRHLYSAPVAQFFCLLLMILTWTILATRWRVGKSGACLGWRPRRAWLAFPVAALAPAAMIAAGCAVPPGETADRWLIAAAALAGLNLVWLFGALALRAFGPTEKRLPRAVVADALVPALGVAMLVFACLVPVFRAEEKRWFARDELLKLTPRFTRFEAAVADQLFAELRATLGYR